MKLSNIRVFYLNWTWPCQM